ncbi:Uncharacterized membrane protein YsdA, DUF1294 family [Devosia enhydra]|uniref:Uncharacterized membrane protein YsdA, DUF1294 family n=1 Tax=Devosia enhydra TaxID=665118 RepID=A0A1K2HX38_9HYPH|nr:DUF1294 domain-containing protein [Devosia enhydra]SFZ82760.1 Uncharacterized membrane protein YsdA, DUF1294 family [Devosia enhydra]
MAREQRPPPRRLPSPVRLYARVALAAVLSGLVVASVGLERMSIVLGLAYAAIGLLSFLTYGVDKRLAEAGGWRIPENQLHLLDLLCGIIGGLLGQLAFRHKISKPGFGATSFVIAALHAGLLGSLATGLLDPAAIGSLVAAFA